MKKTRKKITEQAGGGIGPVFGVREFHGFWIVLIIVPAKNRDMFPKGTAFFVAHAILPQIHANSVHPGSEIRFAAELAESAIGRQECFLGEVFPIGPVPAEPNRQGVDTRPVLTKERFEVSRLTFRPC